MAVYVPEVILMDILSMLPVKTLLRFRSVSKSWRSLISRTDFAKMQLKRASSSVHRNDFHKIIDWGDDNGIRCIDSFDDLSAIRSLRLPFFMHSGFNILGSCNGLLCVCTSAYKMFHLWNPCTNEYKKVPPLKYGVHVEVAKYGFGYDSTTDDYKLLILTCRTSNGYRLTNLGVVINLFSLKIGTCSHFEDTKYLSNGFCESFCDCGIFSNGAIHWIFLEYSNVGKREMIVSFGLAKESFSTIHVPDICGLSCNLSVLEGCLCITRSGYRFVPRLHLEFCTHTIWMMKEYGVSSSWTEFMTMEFKLDRDNNYSVECSPLFLTRQGKIIFMDVDTLFAHHGSETKSLKVYSNPIVHVETLISPNASTETINKRKRKRVPVQHGKGLGKEVSD